MAATPNLRTALAAMIADYRTGEIPAPDTAHVDRWISQFPAAMHDPILTELLHVFRRTYFTRANVQTFIDSIVTNANFAGPNPCQFWQGVKILSLQTAGNSQKDMIALLAGSLQRQCGLALASCGAAPHTYLYLDDVLFSGGRIRFDLIKWVSGAAPAKCKLAVLVIGSHTLGQGYSGNKILEAARSAGKMIDLSWRAASFEDRKSEINNSDVLRPTSIPADRRHMPMWRAWHRRRSSGPSAAKAPSASFLVKRVAIFWNRRFWPLAFACETCARTSTNICAPWAE